jgi:hypothetical protein
MHTNGVKCRGLRCERTTWKTCTEFATDFEHMQCELFLSVPTVRDLPAYAVDSARNVVRACVAYAIGGCTIIGGTTTPAGAFACLQPAFLSCVQGRGGQILGSISLVVDQSCGWRK